MRRGRMMESVMLMAAVALGAQVAEAQTGAVQAMSLRVEQRNGRDVWVRSFTTARAVRALAGAAIE
jgi:hypothetical protein